MWIENEAKKIWDRSSHLRRLTSDRDGSPQDVRFVTDSGRDKGRAQLLAKKPFTVELGLCDELMNAPGGGCKVPTISPC